MTIPFTVPHHHPVWQRLQAHADRLALRSTLDLFADTPERFNLLSRQSGTLLADFSKQRWDTAALADLLNLAQACSLPAGIEALFAGKTVNFTEKRAALHMALRGSCPAPAGYSPDDHAWCRFAAALRAGQVQGVNGTPIRRIINLGIGGSDLGPRMVCEALAPHTSQTINVRFVANVDPHELNEALADAEPASTLFIISSKSFTTAETLTNAASARQWLYQGLGEHSILTPHFAAITNATEAAAAFGIAAERIFPIPEWVGGRYSVWSAIGLPVLAAIGEDAFDAFLSGARVMDIHFRTCPLTDNLPVLMGLAGLWNSSFLKRDTLAVLPYAYGLRSFPAWLQQLEMESNGKHTLRDGSTAATMTAPIVWGGVGTVGQHAFHQLFYQGTHSVPLDFIVPVGDGGDARQQALVDNAFAQAAALMQGRSLGQSHTLLTRKGFSTAEADRLAPHLVCTGNQPSTTLLIPRLDPFHLGQLLALYEHKVFVQGWIWGINSFDQYGVELGKDMGRALAAGLLTDQDSSTTGLIAAADRLRNTAP